MFGISPSARLRPSPYFQSTVDEGVTAFTTYNHMLMPTSYGKPEEEYWRLMNGVSQWDVAVERQVQIQGPDAAALVQMLSPRHVRDMPVGLGKYVPLCNHEGHLINDPILLRLDEHTFWFSIADSNIWFWAQAIAAERGLRVTVSEPDVSPLALQGPKAVEVVSALFGDWVRELRYFGFRQTSLQGIPLVLARSGWSKQGGYELYLQDGSRGDALWSLVREAGKPWDIGPGNPSFCERVETGLLSYGGDTDAHTTPFEVRLGKYVNLDVADDVVGIAALRRHAAAGPKRHQLGLVLEGDTPTQLGFLWHDIEQDGRKVGSMTNCVWSYRLLRNIGFALIDSACQPGTQVQVRKGSERLQGRLVELPFL